MFDHLLVLDIVGSSVLRVDLDGTVHKLVDDAGCAPDGIALAGDRIYWTLMGPPRVLGEDGPSSEADYDFSAPNGGLSSASIDGSDVTTVIPEGGITTGKELTDADGWLYWGDREGGKISRARVDGSHKTDLVIRPRDPATGMVDIGDQCVGVAVDTVDGYVYWTQKGPSKGGSGRIFRAGIEIPDGESAENRSDIETLWSDLPEPIDLWVDAATRTLWWTDRGAGPDGNTLNRAPIPAHGQTGEPATIVSRGFAEAIGLTLDTDAGIAYVSALDGTIRGVPIRDGAPAERVIASVEGGSFTGIVGVPA